MINFKKGEFIIEIYLYLESNVYKNCLGVVIVQNPGVK